MKSAGEKALRFWTAYGKSVFLLLALIFASWVASQNYENYLLFWIGIAGGIITFLRLPYAYNEIKSFELRLAWAFINFALFVSVSSALTFEWKQGVFIQSIGITAAAAVCMSVYCYCAQIGALLKLDKNFYSVRTPNGIIGWMIFYCVFLSITVFQENEKAIDKNFEKVEFVGVKKWDKEIYDGNTYYVVTTEDGKVFGVKPSDFPEIRNIHSGTQIRVIIDTNYNIYNNYSRLEIKN